MIDYIAVRLKLNKLVNQEVLEFYLSQNEVSSIEEKENELVAYFEAEVWPKAESALVSFLSEHEIEYAAEEIENQNWNALWEASFEPVNINDFCYVRAPFHEASPIEGILDLILEPKMAFGTAHHETTFMMMSQMQEMDFADKTVFDYGCGTAILSVLAEKMGARHIYAIDIEENAVENAIYNSEINKCIRIQCERKVLSEVQIEKYDVILANINRQVLLDSAERLGAYLNANGVLLVSGILEKDEDLVTKCYETAGFKIVASQQKGEWKCLKLELR